jgi:hypothetical protein
MLFVVFVGIKHHQVSTSDVYTLVMAGSVACHLHIDEFTLFFSKLSLSRVVVVFLVFIHTMHDLLWITCTNICPGRLGWDCCPIRTSEKC